jgi:hypothetical protein
MVSSDNARLKFLLNDNKYVHLTQASRTTREADADREARHRPGGLTDADTLIR